MSLKPIIDFVASMGQERPEGSSQTITGRVVGLAYYATNKASRGGGLDQKLGDARASVKWEGNPAGIVTSDGKAYQVVGGLADNNNAKIANFLGQTVKVTGQVSLQNGIYVLSADDATVVK